MSSPAPTFAGAVVAASVADCSVLLSDGVKRTLKVLETEGEAPRQRRQGSVAVAKQLLNY